MPSVRWLSIGVLGCVGASPLQQSVFRTEVHSIPIYATVRGRDGRLVSNLTRADFRVLVDGRQVELTDFSNAVQPITVAVLVDAAMGPRMARAVMAAHNFIDALLSADTAAIGTFGPRFAVSPHLTSNHALLHRIVDEEIWPAVVARPQWPAIEQAVTTLAPRDGQRTVIVLSGGSEGGQLNPLRARVQREGVMIYGILFQGTLLDRLAKGPCPRGEHCVSAHGVHLYFTDEAPATNLNPLADLSGGGHFTVKDDDDLAETMAEVAEEIRHLYVLVFTPPVLDGKVHEIAVQPLTGGLRVRARTSYLGRRDDDASTAGDDGRIAASINQPRDVSSLSVLLISVAPSASRQSVSKEFVGVRSSSHWLSPRREFFTCRAEFA